MPGNSARIVGQPILAAAGFQPALPDTKVDRCPKEPPERRLRARLPAPQLMIDPAYSLPYDNASPLFWNRCASWHSSSPPESPPALLTRNPLIPNNSSTTLWRHRSEEHTSEL